MIRDPMSLKIAKNKDIPESHKIEFFRSMIPLLKEYAKAMNYNKSKDSKIVEECQSVINKLRKDIKVEHLIDHITNFELDKVFRDKLVSGFKEEIYFFVKEECP